MNRFHVPQALVEQLGWLLVHSVWQLALIALVTVVLAWAMRRASARARYAMLLVALVATTLSPLATLLALPQPQPAPALVPVLVPGEMTTIERPRGSTLSIEAGPTRVFPDEARVSPAAPPPRPLVRPMSTPVPVSFRDLLDAAWPQVEQAIAPRLDWIVGLWCLGVCLFALRPAIGIREIRRLRRVGVSPVADNIAALLSDLARRMGLARPVAILQSACAPVPVVVGHLRPLILLPVSLVSQMPIVQLEAILAHELAHVRRHDYLVNLWQTLVETVLFYHPAVWWLSRRIRQERENCCDDVAVAVVENRVEYGRALLAVAQLQAHPAGLALGVRSGSLPTRIARLFPGQRRSHAIDSGNLVASGALLSAMLVLAVWATAIARDKDADQPAVAAPAANDDTATATGTETAPASDEHAPAAAEAPADTLHKTVRVVNERGEPVAGATVAPWAMRSVQGDHGVWSPKGFGESDPPTLSTDADGKATISFPKFARKAERILAKELTCTVRHPDYVETGQNDVSVTPEELEKVATIVVHYGARLEVTATAAGQELPVDRVRAQFAGPAAWGAKANDRGRLELPRLAPGTQLLRVIYFPEQGPMMISDVQTLKLTVGERRELAVEVKPSVRVEGRLDPAVPRPVKNGRVVANIFVTAGNNPQSLYWEAVATPGEDGTFVFDDLPRGDLQVIALCDGFMAKAGTPPAFAERPFSFAGSPQVFHLTDATNEIVVKMVPTASCRIQVLGPDGQPVAGAICAFSPNVHWWDGGSQMYCAPGDSTANALRNPKPRGELREWREELSKLREELFAGTTDADGTAIVRNLPAAIQEGFTILHDDLELPLFKANRRIHNVELEAGKQAEVTVRLQKKGMDFIGTSLSKADDKSPEELAKTKEQEAAAAKNVELAKKFDTAEAAYAGLTEQYDTALAEFRKAMQQAGEGKDRAKVAEGRPRSQDYVPAFFLIAEKYPDDPAAIRSLVWIARHEVFREEAEKALKFLGSKYSRSHEIADYVATTSLYGEPFEPYEEFLRAVLKDNPDRNVQGGACATLARYLKMAVDKSRSNLVQIALEGGRSMRAESLAALKHLQERGLDNVAAESEALFERTIKDYADVRLPRNLPPEAGEYAREQLFELRNLSIGKPALALEGTDISGAPLKLSDYRGKVVVLDFGSHRSCGICSAMYPQLRSLVEQFEGQPFALIGVNIGDDLDELKQLASKGETTWRVVWDGDAPEGPISKQWVIHGMPTIYVIDQAGAIRNKGFLQGQALIGTVQMLLKEMAVSTTADGAPAEAAPLGAAEPTDRSPFVAEAAPAAADETAPARPAAPWGASRGYPAAAPGDMLQWAGGSEKQQAALKRFQELVVNFWPTDGAREEESDSPAARAVRLEIKFMNELHLLKPDDWKLLEALDHPDQVKLELENFDPAALAQVKTARPLAEIRLPGSSHHFVQRGAGVESDPATTEEIVRHPKWPQSLAKLERLPACRSLWVDVNQLTPDQFPKLIALAADVEELTLESVDEKYINTFRRTDQGDWEKLSEPYTGGTQAGDALAAEIAAKAKHLTRLELARPLSAAGLRSVAQLVGLEHLSIVTQGIAPAGVEPLGKLVHLETLKIGETNPSDQPLGDAVARVASQMPSLRKLIVEKTPMSAEGLAALATAKQLQQLDVKLTEVDDRALATVSHLTGLRRLHLSGEGKLTPDGFAPMGQLRLLTELELPGAGLTDKSLEALRPLTELKRLTLHRGSFVGTGFAGGALLAKLEQLDVWGSAFNDDGCRVLAKQCPKLSFLDLSETQVTDAGLRSLAKIAGLDTLDLDGTRITDAGLAKLKGLEQLSGVGTRNTAVTPAGIADLEAAWSAAAKEAPPAKPQR